MSHGYIICDGGISKGGIITSYSIHDLIVLYLFFKEAFKEVYKIQRELSVSIPIYPIQPYYSASHKNNNISVNNGIVQLYATKLSIFAQFGPLFSLLEYELYILRYHTMSHTSLTYQIRYWGEINHSNFYILSKSPINSYEKSYVCCYKNANIQ